VIARIHWHGCQLEVDLSRGTSIAIPLDPHGPQPSFFSDRPARATPLHHGDFIGDVRQGGSCNAEWIELAPHCHGTHTECRGHLSEERLTVQDVIDNRPTLALLVSLEPEKTDAGPRWALDRLEAAWPAGLPDVRALIVRTLPNDPQRRHRDYARDPGYPVFTPDAMRHVASLSLKHLLLDTPSLDAVDERRLTNHRRWWGLDDIPAPRGIDPARRSVTEMIYVPDQVRDGLHWLHFGLSPILGDATPSRPSLYPVRVGA